MQVPKSNRSRGLLLVVPVLLVLAVGVGSAFGAIPNPGDGKYYACLVRSTGAVKVINYPKVSTCPKGQKLISWNATGPQGLTGTAGITKIGLTTVTAQGAPAGNNEFASATVTCPAGKVVGGGYAMSGTPINVVFYASVPVGVDQWSVGAWNASGSVLSIGAYAICMTTDPGTVIARKKGAFRPAGELINPETGKRKR